MSKHDSYSATRRAEIHRKRQLISIRLYMIIGAVAAIGALSAINLNQITPRTQRIQFSLIVVLSTVVTFSLLYLCFRLKNRMKTVDSLLFIITLQVYLTIVFTSPVMKVINLIVWLPMLIMFIFTLQSRLYTFLFISVHLIVTSVYFYLFREYTMTVHTGTYMSIYITTVIIFTGIMLQNRLSTNYETTILEDYLTLHEKNLEITALNEEYYAAQEELMQQYDEIQFLAYHDPLTKLLNRRGFSRELHRIKKESCEGHVVMIDVRRFNELNKVYGYDFGDEILKEIAQIIQDFNEDKSIAARMGNDVFALQISGAEDTDVLVHRLQGIQNSFSHESTTINIGYNFGLVPYGNADENSELLIKNAEIALSSAKENADTTYQVFDEALAEATEYRIMLMNDLERAIRNKTLHMNYQPIYYAKDRTLSGFEALVRWQHNILGFIGPNVFIPMAEKSTLIEDLGVLVRDLVFSDIDEVSKGILLPSIQNQSIPYERMTVNVAGKELSRPDFAQRFIAQLKNKGVSPEYIGVEITESVLINEMNVVQKQLTQFREAGIKIYLDDFGTGYSSLNYLDKLPIDVLKIDRTFILESYNDERKQQLLKGVVNLAKSLDISIVAEGVETEEQYQLVQKLGIDYVQGYYFSRPLTKEAVFHLVNEEMN